MYDVAKLAGVSVKTVSNVINGYPYIRATTRDRVLAAIDQLDYRINVSARNLRSGRTGMIALAVPELRLPYFAELADSVITAAEEAGLNVLIQQTNGDRDRELRVLSGLHRHLTDGALFSPLALGEEDREAFQADFPLVLLGERIFRSGFDHVTMRNAEGARAATEYLLSLGRRRIAVIGAHPGELMGSARLRVDGYLEAITAAGIEIDPALIAEAGLWHRSTGAAAMNRLLDSRVAIDAVFALNDALALGALHVLHERHIAVPEQIAVIGFDDIEEAQYSVPTLTSVAPGREQIARTAIELLQSRIAGGDVVPVEVLADFEIHVRESTEG
ncbi:LacI family transcriptional regulator [Jiangella ureilytica]|uniref:LacI family transcriptional regulator n=2 Tax=Jiangella ureilytica TaxID=2530374 RepID=A0A4R4RFM7_9ACTN|nr:LacI family transcriptional regulator [Jiangella ureilytica]